MMLNMPLRSVEYHDEEEGGDEDENVWNEDKDEKDEDQDTEDKDDDVHTLRWTIAMANPPVESIWRCTFPIKKWGVFQPAILVYQRVSDVAGWLGWWWSCCWSWL